MESADIPYRYAIYWKVAGTDLCPEVTVYGLSGLIRLNRTASLIWLWSDGHHSVRQILQALRKCFPESPADRLQDEVGRFLSLAESRGLLLCHWDPLQPYRVIGERFLE